MLTPAQNITIPISNSSFITEQSESVHKIMTMFSLVLTLNTRVMHLFKSRPTGKFIAGLWVWFWSVGVSLYAHDIVLRFDWKLCD